MRLIDLSHELRPGMVTDPRLPAPELGDVWTRRQSAEFYEPGVAFQIAWVKFPQNTGTYVDCPFHRHDGMPGVWEIPLEKLVDLPGVVIDAREGRRDGQRLEAALFAGAPIRGRAVLFHTGWDRKWGTHEYGAGGHPFLTAEAARALVEGGAALFGVDALNADDFADKARPAHTILLGAGVPIVENLTGLGQLPRDGFRFDAAPVKAVGCGSFPVRAYARVEG